SGPKLLTRQKRFAGSGHLRQEIARGSTEKLSGFGAFPLRHGTRVATSGSSSGPFSALLSMSDPNTPSITDAGAAPVSQTISLNDIGQKYLGALQRVFDTAAFLVEGSRQVNERTYDDFSSAVRFLPSQQQHRNFDAAKEESERWLLRNLLADA